MTAVASFPRADTSSRPSTTVFVVAVVGCVLLASRPALVALTGQAIPTLVVLFVALLVFGVVLLPDARESLFAPRRLSVLVPLAFGIGVFALGRVTSAGAAPGSLSTVVVATNVLAAVAEEAWFRRLWFALLEPAGPVAAIGGTSVLFALVHVATYGMWVLPLDLAAGLLLGWQRHATGSWYVPACTHAIANLLVLL
jgi:membrane protease YdiL (CAAX protease family)